MYDTARLRAADLGKSIFASRNYHRTFQLLAEYSSRASPLPHVLSYPSNQTNHTKAEQHEDERGGFWNGDRYV